MLTTTRKTKCTLCSIGCGLKVETTFDEATGLEYETADPQTGGALCSKGNYILDLLNHAERLIEARSAGTVITAPEAFRQSAARCSGGVAIVLSGDASVEDAIAARSFADMLPGPVELALYFPTGDGDVHRACWEAGMPGSTVSLNDIADSTCICVVGDPFDSGPVIAGSVLESRYRQRGNRLAVISEQGNTSSKFATSHFSGSVRKTMTSFLRAVLELGPGESPVDTLVEAGKLPSTDDTALSDFAAAFVGAKHPVLILDTQDPLVAGLAALTVRAAGESAGMYQILTHGNAGQLCRSIGRSISIDDLLDNAAKHGITTLINLGADLSRLRNATELRNTFDGIITAAPFDNGVTAIADIVLPSALWLETDGQFNGDKLEAVVDPPGAALSYRGILTGIAEAMGNPLEDAPVDAIESADDTDREEVIPSFSLIETEAVLPAFTSSATVHSDGYLSEKTNWYAAAERGDW